MASQKSICAVIPAAGEGRRLGLELPKILVPVTDKKTVWEILSGKLTGLLDHKHIVLSPKGAGLFQKQFLTTNDVSISVQPYPKGMGDAIFGAYEHWKGFDHILVLWGDQVNVSALTLKAVIQCQKDCSENSLTIAINSVQDPYVQYVFNKDNSTLLHIKQSREGDTCDKHGFADVGVFGLSTKDLWNSWQEYTRRASLGEQTGEINFLPFLAYISKDLHWHLNLIQVQDPLESRGINTLEDLEFFRKRFSE